MVAIACAPARVQEPLSLKVGVAVTPAPALPESALWLARDLGFFQKEGLDVQLVEVDATPSVITAMRTGDLDIGDVNFEDVIRLTSSGDLPLRAVSSASGRNFFMIVGKSSIGSVAELSNKSFAIARVGSQDHALSSKVLGLKVLGLGVAVMLVTHSLDEALYLGDRVVLLGPRPGAVQEVLDVDLPRPRWEYDYRATPEFIEHRAHLWERIRAMVADQPEFRLARAY